MRIDEVPALVHGQGTRDFDGRVLAGLHRIDGHRRVPVPGRGDDDCVEIIALKQLDVSAYVQGLIEHNLHTSAAKMAENHETNKEKEHETKPNCRKADPRR